MAIRDCQPAYRVSRMGTAQAESIIHLPVLFVSTGHRVRYTMSVPDIAYAHRRKIPAVQLRG
eukprot:3179231-Rhodomonas_salina.1